MEDVARWLEVLERELGAEEAKLELGGRAPEVGDRVIVRETSAGFRVVVRFAETPEDAVSVMSKLDTMIAAFEEALRGAASALPRIAAQGSRRELSDLLAALSGRVGAIRAVVLDDRSPVVFGDSHDPMPSLDVSDASFVGRLLAGATGKLADIADAVEDPQLDLDVGLDDRALRQLEAVSRPPRGVTRIDQLRLLAAVGAVRETSLKDRVLDTKGDVPHLARTFANIYRVLLVFEEPFSEMHADGHLVRALPAIEKATLALPPLDPVRRAKVERLRPR